MKHVFASEVVIDHAEHEIYIDGARLPWWLRDVPEVEPMADYPITDVTFTVRVDGLVTIKGDGQHRIIDPEIGDIREWVKRTMREATEKRFPWLVIP